jgi:hypothetical protein
MRSVKRMAAPAIQCVGGCARWRPAKSFLANPLESRVGVCRGLRWRSQEIDIIPNRSLVRHSDSWLNRSLLRGALGRTPPPSGSARPIVLAATHTCHRGNRAFCKLLLCGTTTTNIACRPRPLTRRQPPLRYLPQSLPGTPPCGLRLSYLE